jgi:hypothetical protein
MSEQVQRKTLACHRQQRWQQHPTRSCAQGDLEGAAKAGPDEVAIEQRTVKGKCCSAISTGIDRLVVRHAHGRGVWIWCRRRRTQGAHTRPRARVGDVVGTDREQRLGSNGGVGSTRTRHPQHHVVVCDRVAKLGPNSSNTSTTRTLHQCCHARCEQGSHGDNCSWRVRSWRSSARKLLSLGSAAAAGGKEVVPTVVQKSIRARTPSGNREFCSFYCFVR